MALAPLLRRVALPLNIRCLSTIPPNLHLADPSLLVELPPQDRAVLEPVFEREAITTEFIDCDVLGFGTHRHDDQPHTIQLRSSVFGLPLRLDVLHNMVTWERACKRQGTAKTKRIGEISGSGRKVRPQKGSGRARAGHSRPPHWKGGAKAHGPVPRDWSYKLNKKYRRLGMCTALSQKRAEGNLFIVDDFNIDSIKTKDLFIHLSELDLLEGGTLFVEPEWTSDNNNFFKASNKLLTTTKAVSPRLKVVDMLKHKNLVLSVAAVDALTYGLTHPIKRRFWQSYPNDDTLEEN